MGREEEERLREAEDYEEHPFPASLRVDIGCSYRKAIGDVIGQSELFNSKTKNGTPSLRVKRTKRKKKY